MESRGQARDIAARAGEASDETAADGIGHRRHDDGDGTGRALGCLDDRRRNPDDDLHLEPHELGRHLRQALRLAGRPAVLDDEVAPFDIAQLAQPLAKALNRGVRAGSQGQEADAVGLARLLSAGDSRRRYQPDPRRREKDTAIHQGIRTQPSIRRRAVR